jgi:hypothetical protein
MALSKDTAYCIGGLIGGVVIIFIVLVFVLPIIGPLAGQHITEEVSEIVPGFDSFAFITSFICLFSIAMILIKKKIVKNSN